MSEPAVLAAGTVNAAYPMRVDAPPQSGASLIAQRLLRTSGGRAGNIAVHGARRERRLQGGGGDRLATAVHDAPDGSVLVVDTELSPAALEPAFEAARERGRATVVDPTRSSRVTDRLLELSDHVTPNAGEAADLTGIAVESPADAHRAARRLHQRGPRHVYVRLPRGGCITLWPDGEALLNAPEDLDVVDTTGAGDAFAGTLATAIIAGLPTVYAACLAVAAAACAVTGFGAQESYPQPPVLYATASRARATIYPRAAVRGSSSGGAHSLRASP